MPRRYTAEISRSVTVVFDVPDTMSDENARWLLRREADRLFEEAEDHTIETEARNVTLQEVRDSPRSVRRVSDDERRITDEEVDWAGENKEEEP